MTRSPKFTLDQRIPTKVRSQINSIISLLIRCICFSSAFKSEYNRDRKALKSSFSEEATIIPPSNWLYLVALIPNGRSIDHIIKTSSSMLGFIKRPSNDSANPQFFFVKTIRADSRGCSLAAVTFQRRVYRRIKKSSNRECSVSFAAPAFHNSSG